MARIENTTLGQIDIHPINKALSPGVACFSIPRAEIHETTIARAHFHEPKKTKTNGVGFIPDDVLADLLAKDPWTRGLFASGDLVRVAE